MPTPNKKDRTHLTSSKSLELASYQTRPHVLVKSLRNFDSVESNQVSNPYLSQKVKQVNAKPVQQAPQQIQPTKPTIVVR
jgi:hypothetical protein